MLKKLLAIESEIINKFSLLENDIKFENDDCEMVYVSVLIINSFTGERYEIYISRITSSGIIDTDGNLIEFKDIYLYDLAYLYDNFMPEDLKQ